MKKIALSIAALGLLLTIQPAQSKAETALPKSPIETTKPTNEITEAKNAALVLRLNEIKDMDHSQMKLNEKIALRKEVRSIKNQMQSNGGAYISVGALIIIILLLIIIL